MGLYLVLLKRQKPSPTFGCAMRAHSRTTAGASDPTDTAVGTVHVKRAEERYSRKILMNIASANLCARVIFVAER
ncbi:MAG: hypothetical protein C5B57_01095 [Blastocatellia bacterium]|nr:MAG: hypothetical protein C5B57_01095 [Blastocatellia bacterium]